MLSKTRIFFLVSLLTGFVFFSINSFSQESETKAEQKTEAFNPGSFIIDHVTDKYEWHLFGPHEGGVVIPLPLILYSSTNGLNIFLSSKLEGGESHNGYKLN